LSITSIEIDGAYFNTSTTLNIFETLNDRITLVYGRNGSGKSSIARAFSEKLSGLNEFSNVDFLDITGGILSPNIIDTNHIHVYNEEYVNKNIKFEEQGLSTIVMLGNQVNLEQDIKNINKKIDSTQNSLTSINTSFEEYTDQRNIKSPQYHLNRIAEKLRNKWAQNERLLRNLRQNASVNEQFIHNLFSTKSQNEDLDHLKDLYSKLYTKLSNNRGNLILPQVNLINPNSPEVSLSISDSLIKKIEDPPLNERENIILELIKTSSQVSTVATKEIMEDPKISTCPVCFSSLTSDYKNATLSIISNILTSKESDNHKFELKKLRLSLINCDLSLYKTLATDLIDDIETLIQVYNIEVLDVNKLIDTKIENPYAPIKFNVTLGLQWDKINNLYLQLQAVIKEYNFEISQINETIKELQDINTKIAYLENSTDYSQYIKQKQEIAEIEKAFNDLTNDYKQFHEELNSLIAQQQNVVIAGEIINDFLYYIFLDKNRLTIEINQNRYVVRSRGNQVKLSSLSIGERNAISLCYFFSEQLRDKKTTEAFTQSSFVILDDPISSFDFENKIGMYSFLRRMLNSIINGNTFSKCLIFSHDLEVLQQLDKVIADSNLGSITKYKELKDKYLYPFTLKTNEYSVMLNQIYLFACTSTDDVNLEHSIGNIMRRVLEAFSTFTYKTGIDKLSTNRDILNLIENEAHRNYFENSMYRLVLNGESHLQDATLAYPNRNFSPFISNEEKVRTAKDVLIFLYLISPLHLKNHLSITSGSIRTVQQWLATLPTQIVVTG